MSFLDELSELITKHKDEGYDIGEMIADMEGEIEGLKAELSDKD